jgi:ankyrin repeat protein
MVNGHIFWSLTARSFSLHFSKNGLMQVVEALWDKHGNATASNDGDVALALQCACNSSNPGAAVASLLSVMCSSGTASHPLVPAMLAAREPETGLPAIFVACQRGSASAVEQLCHAGASVEFADATGRNLYHYLAVCVAKLHPHTILVVGAASCGRLSHVAPGTKCIAVRAPHGSELLVPKGSQLLLVIKFVVMCIL